MIAETEGPDAAGRRLEELASSEIPRPAQDDGWLADLWLTRAQLELRCAEPNSLVVDRALHKAEEHGVSPLEWMIVKGAGMIERGLFEWLPYNWRIEEEVPEGRAERVAWAQGLYEQRAGKNTERYRERLIETYGPERGARIRFAEIYEISEYASPLTEEERARLFPFVPGNA